MNAIKTDAHVCAEIQYDSVDGMVHSDICAVLGDGGLFAEKARAFLHANLDEWIDKSKGTGFFYVGNVREAID